MAVSPDPTSPKMCSSSHCGANIWPHYVVNQSRCASGGIIIVRINVVIFLLPGVNCQNIFDWDLDTFFWMRSLTGWRLVREECNIMWDNALWDTGEQLYQTQVCRVKCNPYLLTLLTMSHAQLKPMFFALKRNIIPVLSGKQMFFSLPQKQSPSFSVPEIV